MTQGHWSLVLAVLFSIGALAGLYPLVRARIAARRQDVVDPKAAAEHTPVVSGSSVIENLLVELAATVRPPYSSVNPIFCPNRHLVGFVADRRNDISDVGDEQMVRIVCHECGELTGEPLEEFFQR